jgi:hypothetical protein
MCLCSRGLESAGGVALLVRTRKPPHHHLHLARAGRWGQSAAPVGRALVAKHGEERSLEEALLEELYSFVGEGWEQEDDITLLTLRCIASQG